MTCPDCGQEEYIYALPNQFYPGWFSHHCSKTGRERMRQAGSGGADGAAMSASRSLSASNAAHYAEHGVYPGDDEGEAEPPGVGR